MAQTMISSEVMISATICPPSAMYDTPLVTSAMLTTIHHLPSTAMCVALATDVSRRLASTSQQPTWSSMQECNWKHIFKGEWECPPTWDSMSACICKQPGSLRLSVIVTILESIPRSLLGNIHWDILRTVLELYHRASWMHNSCWLGVYICVQSAVFFRTLLGACNYLYMAVWFQAYWMQHDV